MFRISLLLLLLVSNTAFSQWTQVTNAPNNVYNVVEAFNNQVIYLGADNAFIRTQNGGVTWDSLPILDNLNVQIPGTAFSSVHFVSATEGYATGLILNANSEIIYKTINGGQNWTPVYLNNTGQWPRLFNKLLFASPDTAYAVGSNGRIIRSVDGGSTWSSLSSGISDMLNDVAFVSPTLGFVVGDGKILKTTNSGLSWSVQNFSGVQFNAVHFLNSQTGYAAGDFGAFYKTTNGGFAWQQVQIGIPGNPNFTDIHFTSIDTGYATASDMILKTCDRGLHWEKYTHNEFLYSIAVKGLTGWACGEAGSLFKTNDINLDYSPVAYFSIPSQTICHNTSAACTNLSDPTCSFTWFLSNQLAGSTYNANILCQNPNQNDTITLVAAKGGKTDSFSIPIYTQPSLQFSIAASLVQDTICAGQTAQAQVSNTITGVLYSLRNGTTTIGLPQVGNGGTLTFTSGAIAASQQLNIYAELTIPGCGTGTATQNLQVIVANANSSLPIVANKTIACRYDTISISLYNSEPGVTYRLMKGGVATGTTLTGNGGLLTFNNSPFTANTTFGIQTISPQGCISQLSQTISVTIETPKSYFRLSTFNPEIGIPVNTLNNSVNASGTYQWNFSTSGNPQTSTQQSPQGIIFSTPGDYQVQLISISTNGCKDTLTQPLHVINNVPYDTCRFSQIVASSPGEDIIALEHDYENNLFSFYSPGSSASWMTYSNHGDSLLDINLLNNNYNQSYYLTKYDVKGVPAWTIRMLHRSNFSQQGDLEIDSAGNIYLMYYHNDHSDSLRIYSSDQSLVTIKPTNGTNTKPLLILKFNKDGIFQWFRSFQSILTNRDIRLRLDHMGHLYACSTRLLAKLDLQGNILWSKSNTTTNLFSDVAFDQAGNILALLQTELRVQKYDTAGTLLFTTPPITFIGAGTTVITGHFVLDNNDNMYISGNVGGSIIFAGDTISNNYVTTSPDDFFLCKISPTGQHEWLQQFLSDGLNSIKGMEIKDDNLYLIMIASGDTIYPPNLPPINIAETVQYLYQCDTSGNNAHRSVMCKDSIVYLIFHNHLLSFSKTNDEIALGLKYVNSFQLGGKTVIPSTGAYFNDNDVIFRGNINSFISGLRPAGPPTSFFTTSTDTVCIGAPIHLSDLSNNTPTSWNWSFPGGTPASSTVNNPVVIFNTPGTYTISLTASNLIGTGTTYDITVVAVGPPTISVSGNTSSCSGAPTVLTASGASSYQWSNGMIAPSISVSPSATTVFSVIGMTFNGCTDSTGITLNILPGSGPPNGPATQNFCGTAYPTIADLQASGNNIQWYSSPYGGQPLALTTVLTNNNTYFATQTTPPCPASEMLNVQAVFFPATPVSLSLQNDTVCLQGGLVNLTGTPSGGVYSGNGITGSTFDPVAAGLSNHQLVYTYIDNNGCSASDSIIVYVSSCNAISESAGQTFVIYPNPANDIVILKFPKPDNELLIYDISGKVILHASIHSSLQEIDIRGLASGLYFIKINGNNQLSKLVIDRSRH